jgi:hydroxypyruvate reductase
VNTPLEPLARALEASLHAALRALDPSALVTTALPPRPPKRARVRVVAAGKAAPAMTAGALARWPDAIEDALVVTVPGAGSLHDALADPRVTTIEAGHPLPDEASARAAGLALARAAELDRPDLLLALVSGGASALLAHPPDGLSPADARALVAALLEGGVPIADVNTVRRHLSSIHGGRLARAAARARTLTLIVSDVIGGAAHDVGSGPTVTDPTTVDDARAILARAPLSPDLRARAVALLSESLEPGAEPIRLRATILASPETLAQALSTEIARRAGLDSEVAPAEQGAASDVVRRRVEAAHRLAPGAALVIPCEPTLALAADRGRGGRAGWVALAAMRDLPPDVVLLCAASDGVDGSSGHAGAIVTRGDAERVAPVVVERALARFDDAPIHAELGTALPGGPTGTNLTDVHVVARARA